MDKSVFYILCFLILQNVSTVLCAEDPCKTVETCKEKIVGLTNRADTLLDNIKDELKYINDEFDEEKEGLLKAIDKENDEVLGSITTIETAIKNDDIKKECVKKAKDDLTAEKIKADPEKEKCGTDATKPSDVELKNIEGKTNDLKSKVEDELEECNNLKTTKMFRKIIYRHKENDVFADPEIECLQNILKDNNIDNLETKFVTENENIHKVKKELEGCLEKIDFSNKIKNIVPTLEDCVRSDYVSKVKVIKQNVKDTRDIEFPKKTTEYSEGKTDKITEIVEDEKYQTTVACKTLTDEIPQEKSVCTDNAKKVTKNLCKNNDNCKSSATESVNDNVKELVTFTAQLNVLDGKLDNKCEDKKDFDKEIACLQGLLELEQELNTIVENFDNTVKEFTSETEITDALETCLITKTNFETKSEVVLGNLNTCKKIQGLSTRTTKLEANIVKDLNYVNEEFDGEKTKALKDINEELDVLNTNIIESSKDIGELAQKCVTDANKEKCDIDNEKTKCENKATKPNTKDLEKIKSEVDKLNNINVKNCLSGDDLEKIQACLNDLDTKLSEEKVSDVEHRFNEETIKINGVIPDLEDCLREIKFDDLSANIIPNLNECIRTLSLIDTLQNNTEILYDKIQKEIESHEKSIDYVVDKFDIEATYKALKEEIEKRGENVTEEREGCAPNATETMELAYKGYKEKITTCKNDAKKSDVFTNLENLKTEISTLKDHLENNVTEVCEESKLTDKCEDIIEDFNTAFNNLSENFEKIREDEKKNLKTLTDCLTPISNFKDERTEIITDLIDCINSASNVYLNSMLYISCFILMLFRLM